MIFNQQQVISESKISLKYLLNKQYWLIQNDIIKLLIIHTKMETNGVNYYKGVLLCSRPNESPSIPKEKPFCGRVTPHDSLGLVPTKKFDQHQVRKRVLPVLSNHKKWLAGFQKKIVEQKQSVEIEKQKQIERLQKIKKQGTDRRQTFKKSSSIEYAESNIPQQKTVQNPNEGSASKQNNVSDDVYKQKKRLAKKGEKPGWAKTDKQRQAEQQQEVDQLLDFFDNNDVKDYLDDSEINRMLKDLKERIQGMKNQTGKDGDWRKKHMERLKQVKQQGSDEEKKDDILSRISRNSEAKSVASQKTAERVEQLQKKKQQKDWQKNTVTDKRSHAASVDMQIAKNVADEVLRNYPALKHHSNQSIRKLLEKQAHDQIKA